MLFLTRHFGVTGSEADRDPVREKAEIEDIVEKSLLCRRSPPRNSAGRSAVAPM